MSYNDLTWRHFVTAHSAGELAGPGIRRGAAGTRAQGVWVEFYVRRVESRVQAVRFRALGCPHVIAVSDWIAEQSVGRAAAPTLIENVVSLRTRFAVPIEKTGRLLLIEDAWAAAMAADE